MANPTISGVSGLLVHNQNIVISGANFLTKSPAAPHWWDDFEAHTNGANVDGLSPINGPTTWDAGSTGGTTHNPTITTANARHSRSTKRAILDNDPTDGNWGIQIDARITPLGNGSKLYFFFRHYLSKNGSYSDNFKPWLAYTSNDASYLYVGMGDPVADPPIRSDQVMGSPAIYGSAAQDDVLDKWCAYEHEIGLQTSGGSHRCWVHLPTDIIEQWNNQAMTKTLDLGESVATISMGAYHRAAFPTIFHIEDPYIDNTFARIMIGDAATFGACNLREICIPSAWSDSQATCKLRLGLLPDTGTAYLYVVNSTGAVNDVGFPVTLSSGSSSSGGAAMRSRL